MHIVSCSLSNIFLKTTPRIFSLGRGCGLSSLIHEFTVVPNSHFCIAPDTVSVLPVGLSIIDLELVNFFLS